MYLILSTDSEEQQCHFYLCVVDAYQDSAKIGEVFYG